MAEMKGDMGGAACTVATIDAASKLGLGTNIVGIIALTENMPSGAAVKPGDVLRAMNGKTVEVTVASFAFTVNVNSYRMYSLIIHFFA